MTAPDDKNSTHLTPTQRRIVAASPEARTGRTKQVGDRHASPYPCVLPSRNGTPRDGRRHV